MITQRFDIWPFHLDFSGGYPLPQLLIRLVHTADLDASQNGFGVEKLQPQGLSWILNRIVVQMSPDQSIAGTPLHIKSGVVSNSALSSLRGYQIMQHDNTLAWALSKWSVLNLSTRKPAPIPTGIAQHMEPTNWDNAPWPTLGGAVVSAQLRQQMELVYQHQVRYSDLDINRHVNSAIWLAKGIDALPLERLEERSVSTLDIHFVNEGRPGDLLDIYHHQEPNANYISILRNNICCCNIHITWQN